MSLVAFDGNKESGMPFMTPLGWIETIGGWLDSIGFFSSWPFWDFNPKSLMTCFLEHSFGAIKP